MAQHRNGYQEGYDDPWELGRAWDPDDDWETTTEYIDERSLEELLKLPERDYDLQEPRERISIRQIPLGFSTAMDFLRGGLARGKAQCICHRHGMTIIIKDSRIRTIRRLWKAYQYGQEDTDEGNIYEYGLSFDYVGPGTFNGQRRGYWRYQLSWGGPSDEFRFYCDERRQPVRIWGAGNHLN